ncbi:MAG: hypothetical protein V3V99_05360 [candidate division Zixibacteria bacterium]
MNRYSKVPNFIILSFILLLAVHPCFAQDNAVLSGPYFGQDPPELEPLVFAKGIIDYDIHGCPVFTPDGKEAYWTVMKTFKMMHSKEVNGVWTPPDTFQFSLEFDASDAPCLSPDGNRLFFLSYEEKVSGSGREHVDNIRYMDRVEGGWSEPQLVGSGINDFKTHWQFSIANNGSIYFGAKETGNGDIYVSRFENGIYQPAEVLGSNINSEHYDYSPFIDPNENYIIFSRTVGDARKDYADLYISFKDGDGNWSKAVPMEALNTRVHEMNPNVTRDGKYLFFLRNTWGNNWDGSSTHWVSARIIDRYKTSEN